MRLVVEVKRALDGVLWAVHDSDGELLAVVHSSGEASWYAPDSPTLVAESLVGAIREWCLADQCHYDGLNETKLRRSLPPSR